MPRKPRTLRLEPLEQRNMFNGGPVYEDYVLPEQFNARDGLSPSEQIFYLDAKTVPTYEALQDSSRFELLWGQSHEDKDVGVEIGFYLGGTRREAQRQVFLGLRHVYKDTGQDSYSVHDYGSVIPATIHDDLERAEPLSPDYVKSAWDGLTRDVVDRFFKKHERLFGKVLPKNPHLFEGGGSPTQQNLLKSRGELERPSDSFGSW